jgi:hypothetical protein
VALDPDGAKALACAYLCQIGRFRDDAVDGDVHAEFVPIAALSGRLAGIRHRLGREAASIVIEAADDFAYADPGDGSLTERQLEVDL